MSMPPDDHGTGESVELSHYLGVLRRRWRVITVAVLVGLGGSLGYLAVAPPLYDAQSIVALSPITSAPFASNTSINQLVNANNEMEVVQSTAVAEGAARLLHSSASPATLLGNVSVLVPPSSQTLLITYEAGTPREAVAGANAFATAYLQFRTKLAENQAASIGNLLTQRITTLQAEIATANGKIAQSPPTSAIYQDNVVLRDVLSKQISDLRTEQANLTALSINPGTLVGGAAAPTTPSSPVTPLVLVAGLVLGLVAGLLGAILRDRADKRLRTVSDFEESIEAPVLAEAVYGVDKNHPAAEAAVADEPAFQRLLANLLLRVEHGELRTLLAISSNDCSHHSEFVVNLAVALARNGRQVVLVPADVDGSAVRSGLEIRPTVPAGGSRNLLGSGGAEYATRFSTLTVAKAESREALDQLANRASGFDLVVIERRASVSRADTLLIAARVDGVLVMAERSEALRPVVRRLATELRDVGAHVLGGIFLAARGRHRVEQQTPVGPNGNGIDVATDRMPPLEAVASASRTT